MTASSYVWGLDLSQSLYGAGGVGGLLSSTRHSTLDTSYFCYDGNGNVIALVSASDGSLAASYDYSPFGESLAVLDEASRCRDGVAVLRISLLRTRSRKMARKRSPW